MKTAQKLATLLLILAQSSAALAQPKPVEPIYSDEWIKRESLTSVGNWVAAVILGGVAGFVTGAAAVAYTNRSASPLVKKFETPIITLAAVLPALASVYGTMSFNISTDRQRLFRKSLGERIAAKLSTDMTERLSIARNGKGTYASAVFAKGYDRVSTDVSLSLQSMTNGELPIEQLFREYGYLFTPEDRELIQYLYAICRAETSGLPPTAVSNEKGKRPTILSPIGGSDAPGANSAQ